MSKSTGNFLALSSAIEKFGADPIRIALADGGDGVDDANFEESTASAAVLKLYELRRWAEAVILNTRHLCADEVYDTVKARERTEIADCIQRTGPKGFWDGLFESDLDTLTSRTVKSTPRESVYLPRQLPALMRKQDEL